MRGRHWGMGCRHHCTQLFINPHIIIFIILYHSGPMVPTFCLWSGLLSAQFLVIPQCWGCSIPRSWFLETQSIPKAPDPPWHCFQTCTLLLKREQDTKLGLSATGSCLTLVTSLQMPSGCKRRLSALVLLSRLTKTQLVVV